MGVYKIINIIDNKVYVGGTSGLNQRKSCHFSELKRNIHKNHKLQDAYNLYGVDNFRFEIIEFVDDKVTLGEREEYWIQQLRSNIDEHGYNIRIRADLNTGLKASEETKKKISINRTGKGTGKKNHCAETIKLKSEMCKAQNLSQYHTEETEARRLKTLRLQHCDIPIPERHKEAISIHNSGELNGFSKLTDDKVLEILILRRDTKASIKSMEEQFNVSDKTIYKILSGKSWIHITIPFIDKYGPLQNKYVMKKSRSSKITENQAMEIIEILRERKATQKQLAEKYGVSKSCITDIARNVTWRNLSREKQEEYISDQDDLNIDQDIISSDLIPTALESILEPHNTYL